MVNLPIVPDEVGIGGALDGEVDNALQESGMPGSVLCFEAVELDPASQRKGPLQREKGGRKDAVNH
ncbi:hypothetical protein FH972_016490 [Carpinus fangiana]|jgi:hypothetical protein|uniref:Uncharacterized protein n=1 Tax=Carpinus fangiana TaxID=176857 RepID=A0A5N6RG19_9ROSI|nr:hypothetical protein FH972_016490 [Carpinus fangiana]